MKNNSTQQEILLLTGTTFSQRQLCEKDETGKEVLNKEQMEEACWNGFLKELLPEIVQKLSNGNCLFLWQIRKAESFLEIELCDTPVEIENHFSIDPYSFFETIHYS